MGRSWSSWKKTQHCHQLLPSVRLHRMKSLGGEEGQEEGIQRGY